MDTILASSSHCKFRRISGQSNIKSILKKNSIILQSAHGILIGSRAARQFLPNFRGVRHDKNANWDILCSSDFVLHWLYEQDNQIKTIDMIITKSKDGSKLDLYIHCIMQDESKYNFIVPRSSLTYTAYLLENSRKWTIKQFLWPTWARKCDCIINASVKLLLILKKYMLYYNHQWMKTAKDYRQLLTIADPLTDDDTILCDLLIRYNEKIYERRSLHTEQSTWMPYDDQKHISISQNDFFQKKKDERIAFIYQVAMSISTTNDILIGLEHICTQSPLWLVDYIIDNWIDIQNEKFKKKFQLSYPHIKFTIANYRLFPQIPEHVTEQILHNITDTTDFYSMQLVCKQWYGIFHEELFWKKLYISRYGIYSGNISPINSWKMLYLIRLEGQIIDKNNIFDELIDASIDLRNNTGNDVFKLWEDLTHQEQQIESIFLSKINYILSNAFYYQMEETSDQYSVKLIVDGFEDTYSLLKVHLIVRTIEYNTSVFTDHIKEFVIECTSNDKIKYSLKFSAPNLIGFDLGYCGYVPIESTLLTKTSNTMFSAFPTGLLICLFIMMIHPAHRINFIKYLKSLRSRCFDNLSDC